LAELAEAIKESTNNSGLTGYDRRYFPGL